MSDDTMRELTRALHVHADDVHGTPDLAAGARRRARQIRLRRRVVGGTVAAVALAAALPTALSLGDSTRSAPLPADTPTPGETVPAPEPGGSTTLRLADLGTGPAPVNGWVDGSTFHRADGLEVEVPAGLAAPIAFGDGAAGFDYSTGEIWFSEGGSIPGFGPAPSPDGRSVAWFYDEAGATGIAVGPATGDRDGTDTVVADDIPAGVRALPVGFLGDRDLVSNLVGESMPITARRDTFDGSSTTPWDVEEVSTVSAAAQLVAGLLSVTDDGSCWAVLPADGGPALWETCDHSLDHFSPDGELLLAGPAYRSGAGDTAIAVLDAQDGTVLQELESTREGFIVDTAFEDDEHVLAVVVDDGKAAIVRCDLAGSCERATDLAPAPDVEQPYGLPAQP